MFTKAAIRRVHLAVPQQHLDFLLMELGKLKILHLSAADTYSDSKNRQWEHSLVKDEQMAQEIDSGIQDLLSCLPTPPITNFQNTPETHDCLKLYQQFYSIQKEFKSCTQRREKLSNMIAHLNLQAERLKAIELSGISPDMLEGSELCFTAFGTLQNMTETVFDPPCPSLLKRVHQHIIVITIKDKKKQLMEYLKALGFIDNKNSVLKDLCAGKRPHFNEKAARLSRRLENMEQKLVRQKIKWSRQINKLHLLNLQQKKAIEAKKMLLFSSSTVFVTGWANRLDSQKLNSLLKSICRESYILKISDKAETDAPIILSNNRFFRPFELLVRTAGLPGNSEIDPTPFTALTYLIMFGVMFGDLGQGLVLVLVGLILPRLASRFPEQYRLLSDAGGILLMCGCSASVFGLLFGSVFSCEDLIPALWFHPMQHINELFFAVILMGALFIIIGLLLSIANAVISKQYSAALLNRQGLVGLVLYVSGFYLVLRYTTSGILPSPIEFSLLLGLPLTVFMLRDFIRLLFPNSPRPCPGGIFEYMVETLVEIIEMLSGYLGNTISFIRAGAFALSHAGLSIALYTLAGIIHPDISHPAVILVIVFGNIFIILLEGLICAVQSMRLEYYEFFGKFFRGDGKAFTPYSL